MVRLRRVMGERTTRSGPVMSNVKRATRSTQDIDNGDVATRSSWAMSNVELREVLRTLAMAMGLRGVVGL